MEMAELNSSMHLAGKRKSPPETTLIAPNKQYRPWLQQLSPKSTGILHIPTNMLSPMTLQSLKHGNNVKQMESALQKSGKPVVNHKQHISPRGLVKVNTKDEVNESVRSKMREAFASALALAQKHDEFPKGKENLETEKSPMMNLDKSQSFKLASPASITVPVGQGTMSDLPTGVVSSVQKDSEISVDARMEGVNQTDGLKSQYDEVFPRDNVPFTDIIFPNDDLLQGNELSWVMEHVSDLGKTEDYGTNGNKSIQDPKTLASKIEMELFKLFGGVNKKYRERGRSLLFNLKDKNNPELRERVMSEAISAERLCSMTAEELASKELSQWRQKKAEKMAEMVVLRDTEIDVRSLVRKTHKGEFQVEIDPIDSGTVDVSSGITSRSKRLPKAKSHSAKTTLKDVPAKADQATSSATPSLTEEINPMHGLAMDDEMKNVDFLPPIVSLDEFMESLDSEPPSESPHVNSELLVSVSDKSEAEVGSHSKSPKGSPKELNDKSSPTPKPEKIDEVSLKSDASVKLDDDVSKLEKTSSCDDVKEEKVWNGILQLSMSCVVPVTGIFKCGEKAETSEWPAMVEVKGRVRLSGFAKFIQELPKSRTRALMVMYLACKVSIPKSQRGSLFEVIDSYVADQRVGYAEPASGVELYLCPTRGETLDLLTKVISKEQLDEVKSLNIGLIGVVVWRRVIHRPGSRHKHSSSLSSSRSSVLPENKRQRVDVTDKPLVTSMRNHHHSSGGKAVEDNVDDDDDDVPPGFDHVASKDDDDLPEFNFETSIRPVSSPRPFPAQSKSLDQVRHLIHKYGKSASIYDSGADDEDDDIPEWHPHDSSHQVQQPPSFRPAIQDHSRTMFRPPQDGGDSVQHYDRNRSRNRGF